MEAYLAMLLAGLSCGLLLLLPLALRTHATQSADRDKAWRDELPWLLQLLRPMMRWYTPAVESSLSTQRREVTQSQLNTAGAAYLISPAEFLIIRRLALPVGVVVTSRM